MTIRGQMWLGRSGVVVFILSFLFLAGCSTSDKNFKEKVEFFEPPPFAAPKTVGSLWEADNGRAYMFSDLRAKRVGDIVIVRIVEQQSGSKSAETSTDRKADFEASAGGTLFGLNNFASAFVDGLEVGIDTDSEFDGSGSTSRKDTLTGTIAARVVEVMQNGDLRIQGRREVTVNSEKQTMTLKGIVRRIDLDTENTVLSTAIANAKIEYTGLGVVDDVQRPGWGMRIFSWISPF